MSKKVGINTKKRTPAKTMGFLLLSAIKDGIKLIKKMSAEFKPEKYHDNYIRELKKVIEAKVKGKKISRPKKTEKKSPEKIVDIMALLKESLKNKAS